MKGRCTANTFLALALRQRETKIYSRVLTLEGGGGSHVPWLRHCLHGYTNLKEKREMTC